VHHLFTIMEVKRRGPGFLDGRRLWRLGRLARACEAELIYAAFLLRRQNWFLVNPSRGPSKITLDTQQAVVLLPPPIELVK